MANGQDNQTSQMSPQDAYQLVYEQVHGPAFFAKLAEHGIQPQSPQEASDLLKLGGELLSRYTQEQPQAGQSKYAGILSEMQRPATAQDEDALVKAAAAELAADPTWSRAALTLQAHALQQAQQPAA